MAWHDGQGTHQDRKEASASLRAEQRRRAIAIVGDETTPHKKKHRAKKFGLELTYSVFLTRPMTIHQWYETEDGRNQAQKKFEAEMICGKPRYSSVERVSR